MTRVLVSDHAVLRYLERAHGLDIGAVRDHLAERAATAADLGALAVKIEGVKLVLRGHVLVTVLPRNTVTFPPGRRPR
jgi:hypothetical protein